MLHYARKGSTFLGLATLAAWGLAAAPPAQAKANLPAHRPTPRGIPRGAATATAKGTARTVTVTDVDAGKEVILHPGDTLVVRLSDPGDGGASWYVLQDEKNFLLKPLPFQHIPFQQPKRNPPVTGNFGTDVFRFTVGGPGSGATFAEYLRFFEIQPFEKDTAQGRFWQVHVTVGE